MSSPVISATTTDTRLHGRWLVLARITWVVVVMSALIVMLVGIVKPQAFCGKIPCSVFSYSGSGSIVYSLIFSIFPTVIWIVIGGLLFLRKSDDWMVCLGHHPELCVKEGCSKRYILGDTTGMEFL